MKKEQLEILQNLPLDLKIQKTQLRIKEFYEYYNGDVFVSFSGGKDSTVLLDIARKIYPNIKAVFCDTGLEYPEIKEFVKTYNNVDIIKPELTFKQILTKYGYPVISKDVAKHIDTARNWIYNNIYDDDKYHKYSLDELVKYIDTNVLAQPLQHKDATDEERISKIIDLHDANITQNIACILGMLRKDGKIQWSPERSHRSNYNRSKWSHMLNSDFKISDRCCQFIKKRPLNNYGKAHNMFPIIGTITEESDLRYRSWLKYGCNVFNKNPKSRPLSFWKEQDILKYIYENNIKICPIYGDVEETNGEYHTTKMRRTGCMFCCFGLQYDDHPNRFELLKESHPKLYHYCIDGGGYSDNGWWQPNKDGLGIGHVCKFLRVKV